MNSDEFRDSWNAHKLLLGVQPLIKHLHHTPKTQKQFAKKEKEVCKSRTPGERLKSNQCNHGLAITAVTCTGPAEVWFCPQSMMGGRGQHRDLLLLSYWLLIDSGRWETIVFCHLSTTRPSRLQWTGPHPYRWSWLNSVGHKQNE